VERRQGKPGRRSTGDGVARTADCSTPVERRQGKPGRRAWIEERAGRREPTSGGDDGRRATDAVREVRRAVRSDNVQTTLRQYTDAEAYPLLNSLPVEVAEERRDVFVLSVNMT